MRAMTLISRIWVNELETLECTSKGEGYTNREVRHHNHLTGHWDISMEIHGN